MKKKIFNSLFIGLGLAVLAGCSKNNSTSIDKGSLIKSEDVDSSYDEASTVYDATRITAGGSYMIEGDVINSIIVDCDDEVTLILNNAVININNFAGIYVKDAKKVYINLVGENALTTTGDYENIDDNKVDGAIFSKSDLTIKGEGSLNINSSLHGIVCKDNLVISSNYLNIEATKKGIDVNDSFLAYQTEIEIESNTDAIHVENDDTALGYAYLDSSTIKITTKRDGISSSGLLEIENSCLDINAISNTSLSSDSIKGIKAGSNITLSNTIADITSTDDAIHSNNNVTINSGEYIISSDDDGIHADNSLVINGGNINILKSYEGLEGKNVEINSGEISIISSDDGINAAGGNDGSSFNRPGANNFSTSSDVYININGGSITIDASGDGIDSNGNLNVSGGTIIVYGPTNNGNGALDYDGTSSITGGILCAIGYSGMAMNFKTSTQGSILYNTNTTYKAGTKISLSGSDEIFSITSKKAFNSVVISSKDIVLGSYTLTINTDSYTINLTSLLYSNSTGGFNPGGPGFHH